MSVDPIPRPGTLPEGEEDPNLLYIAVGRAIHSWEQMEANLADLYLAFRSIPFSIASLAAYGKDNRRFVDRKVAIEASAKEYFVKKPDQAKEGQFRSIIASLDRLAIERHRIAHGHVSQWTEFPLPQEAGEFEVELTFKYRWAAPFYSTGNLRTDPVGKNAEAIDSVTDSFQALNQQILSLKESL
jgi:hypothetical protein